MSARQKPMPDESAAIIARLTEDVASLTASVEWLTGLAFAAIAREAAAEAPGPTIKALALDTGFSESALRKFATLDLKASDTSGAAARCI